MAETDSPDRSRTITWDDPSIPAKRAQGMAGIDFMTAMFEGEIPPPPILHLMRMSGISLEVGTVTFGCDPDESMYNPIGTIHGGVICTLLDTVVGCAVHTTLPAGQAYTSLDLNVSYLRPVQAASGPLTATGRVVRPGSKAAFAEGTIHDASGKLVATATSTLLVFPVPTS